MGNGEVASKVQQKTTPKENNAGSSRGRLTMALRIGNALVRARLKSITLLPGVIGLDFETTCIRFKNYRICLTNKKLRR